MIAKAEWFSRRKYTGWGFTPVTWQGWVYVIALIIPIFIINSLPHINIYIKMALFTGWGIFMLIEFVSIMANLVKDERERIHEAIAERNALWTIIAVLAAGVAYQAATGMVSGTILVDPVILIAIVAALIVKIASNIYLDKKD